MLLGWLGARLVMRVELVLLLFCMALVPSLGRELVLCCLADTAVVVLGVGAVVLAGFSGRSSSSDRRARTVASGTLLLLPYLELMEERTELEIDPELSSLSLS